MNISRSLFVLPAVMAGSIAAVCTSGAWAAGPVLVQGPTVTITADDMQADSLRMPLEMRGSVLSRPKSVSQIATNLYVRRALANKAQSDGLANDPVVIAALQVARDKVLSDALMEKIDKSATPSDALIEGQARNIYTAKPERFQTPEQVQVRHILFASADDARIQAEKTLLELKAGADFAQLAKVRSADTGSAAKGGDLGFIARGRMVPEFDQAAFALKQPGDLSGVVESNFGFHIVKLDDRRPAGVRPYEEVRQELINEVRGKIQQDARAAVVETAQQGLQVNNEAVEAFAAPYKPAR